MILYKYMAILYYYQISYIIYLFFITMYNYNNIKFYYINLYKNLYKSKYSYKLNIIVSLHIYTIIILQFTFYFLNFFSLQITIYKFSFIIRLILFNHLLIILN